MEQILKHPLALAVLSILFGLGGGWVKDRVSVESRDSANTIRIQALEEYKSETSKVSIVAKEDLERVESSLRTYVSKDEFAQFATASLRASDEMRSDLKDIKDELRSRVRR